MKTYKLRFIALIALGLVCAMGMPQLYAADDPSIKDPLRTQIQTSMKDYIQAHTVGGTLPHYDPVSGDVLRLTFKEMHSGIVKKGDFYVSCADFTDPKGRKIDMDFFVVPDNGVQRTVQGIVHSVDGKKRAYQLESK